MKLLIFDSSSIINLTMNGLLDLLRDLKKIFPGKFLITKAVKYETIDRPLQIKKFELGALKIQQLLDDKVIEMPESIGINHDELANMTKEILNNANHSFSAKNEFMHIIDSGEASCLAVSILAKKKGIDNAIVIDERTTRLLGEKPENLEKIFESKLHTKVTMMKKNFPQLPEIKFIRSTELVYVAFKKGLVKLKDGKVLDALLYATKFKGSSISRDEIEEMKRL